MKALLFFALLSLNLYAKEIAGIEFSDRLEYQKKNLTLNGVGLREATFLKIKVYAGALYVESQTQDGDALAKSTQYKVLKMNFLREVETEKIKDALSEGYQKNCESLCAGNTSNLERLLSKVEGMNKGDVMEFRFNDKAVELVKNNVVKETIASKEFSEIVLRIYIGRNPPNESLKKGLLGI